MTDSIVSRVSDDVMISITSKTTAGGSLAAWAFSDVDWVSVMAILSFIVSVSMNYYFQKRRDRREGELHRRAMGGGSE